MFLFLINPTFALIHQISGSDFAFQEINPENKPIFVYLYDPTRLAPKKIRKVETAWNNLSNGKYQNQIIFATINCQKDPHLCAKIDKPAKERFFWLEPLNGTKVRYFGKPNNEHFRFFIKKQFNYPLTIVPPQKVAKYVDNVMDCTVIVFAVHPKNAPETEAAYAAARKASFALRSVETRFLLIDGYEDVEPYLTVFSSSYRSALFKGNWTAEELTEFILTHSLPLLTPLTPYNLRFLKNNSLFALVHLQSNGRKIEREERQLLESQGSVVPVLKANCEDQEWFCRYVNRFPTDEQFFYFAIDQKNNSYYEYTGVAKLEQKSLLKNWLRDVKAGKIEDTRQTGNGKLKPDIVELREVNPIYDFYNRHQKTIFISTIAVLILITALAGIISFFAKPSKKDQ